MSNTCYAVFRVMDGTAVAVGGMGRSGGSVVTVPNVPIDQVAQGVGENGIV
ncbi:hypothetical protein [Xylella fastidiosa]|uniref:hypothetical protein n=1 Tax=Xylella fastidiosa TaxID=2371 RepID=UPI002368093F|nr:hypothetical protein [Xylella fastidiosa]WDN62720.1 hypothetical protein LOK86_02020 [Xylella fastidiosa subsp. multiplex]